MNRRRLAFVIAAFALCLLAASRAFADRKIEPGATLELTEDVVLSGNEQFEINGTADQRCTLIGNGRAIRTKGEWTGAIRIRNCDIRGLGAAPKLFPDKIGVAAEFPAIDVTIGGKGELAVENSLFDASGGVHVQNDGESRTIFRGNTILENTLAKANKDVGSSCPAFVATGRSTAKKLFQGNRVYRSQARFNGPNWLVGGETDAESNLCIGIRIALIAEGAGTIVRGNYLHLRMPITAEFPYYSQVTTFSTSKGAIGEHNVIRDGEWIVRFVEGEFRYNVITDILDHDLMQNGSAGHIHHNLFVAGKSDSRQGSMSGCIAIVYPPSKPGEGMEVNNNVFDGGGWMDVPAIEVCPGGFVTSVRNNVFYNFGHKERYFKSAQGAIRAAWNDDAADGKPARLGYADYNCFYNPKVKSPRNYLLSVADKGVRKDGGFGKHDLPADGQVDEQVDPKFAGPLSDAFPFSDDDIKAGKVTVSKMLAHYRAAYSPAAGSPLLGAGDPADGERTNIGAIGSAKEGKAAELDQFGRFGAQK